MQRRDFLKLSLAAGAAAFLDARTAQAQAAGMAGLAALPYGKLAQSMTREMEYSTKIEGRLPAGLQGALYRNGPGLFKRNGYRKRHLLDGDGMIRAYLFRDGGVTFKNRFVRTRKYQEEERAGEYRYATWATLRLGGRLRNVFPDFGGGQAGVSVRYRNRRLYAFDESNQPYELAPGTLATGQQSPLGLKPGESVYAAHPKEDLATGEWIHFGAQYGRKVKFHLTEFNRDGSLKWRRVIDSPRYRYIHNFFVTERYILLYLHPGEIQIGGFLMGQRPLLDSIQWKPELGGKVLVVKRGSAEPPVELDAEAAWMWHTLNAYDRNGEIVADYVASDNPDAFLGRDAAFRAIMDGKAGKKGAPSAIRRLVVQPAERKLRMEVLDGQFHEFPMTNPARALHRHRYGYFAWGKGDTFLFNGAVRMDVDSGKRDEYSFGTDQFSGEPVFVSARERAASAGDEGWLLVEVLDGRTGLNRLAVLRADRVQDGPVATVQLTHSLPLSFHGCWVHA